MSLRVCIFGASSLRYMPYLRIYEDLLKKLDATWEVIYWDRFAEDADYPRHHRYKVVAKGSGLALIRQYFGFRRFVRELRLVDDFDLYIVLGMQVGVFLADFLRGKKYIIDIRDFSHEDNLIYRWVAARVVSLAQLVVISSAGFEEWLPGISEPVVSHNIPVLAVDEVLAPDRLPSGRLISYIGGVRYFEQNRRFIECVSGMPGVRLVYHGSGPDLEKLNGLVNSKQIRNVSFTGPFRPEQKPELYRATGFVLCLYGAGGINERTLLPNRLYEACIYYRPLIVSENTYLSDVVRQYGLGIVLDWNNISGLAGQLDSYCNSDLYYRFVMGCRRFINDVRAEDFVFRSRIATLVLGGIGS